MICYWFDIILVKFIEGKHLQGFRYWHSVQRAGTIQNGLFLFQNKSRVIRQAEWGLCVCGSDVSLFACASWRTRPWNRESKSKWDTFVSDCKPLETPEATEPSNRGRWRQWQTTKRARERNTPYKMLNNISSLLSSDATFSFYTSNVFSVSRLDSH